jgi:hypothetical protein
MQAVVPCSSLHERIDSPAERLWLTSQSLPPAGDDFRQGYGHCQTERCSP